MSTNAKKQERAHFRIHPKCLIHVSSAGTCAKGSCDYRANTEQKRTGLQTKYHPYEAHHLICISAAVAYLDYYDSSVVSQIRLIYYGTEWCINQAANMMWLPLKKTYHNGGEVDPGHEVWTLALPCHNWDHNCIGGYTDDVINELKRRIWDAIRDGRPDGTCFTEAHGKAEFAAIASDMQIVLKLRGSKRNGGTSRAIKMKGDRAPYWWLPFSMARTMVAAVRPVQEIGNPVRWTGRRGQKVKQFMKQARGR